MATQRQVKRTPGKRDPHQQHGEQALPTFFESLTDTVEDETFQATNLADVIDLVKGNGHDDRFSTNLRSWVPRWNRNKLFKQWKSKVCSTHGCVEFAGIGEISAGLLDSFRSLSVFCGVILSL